MEKINKIFSILALTFALILLLDLLSFSIEVGIRTAFTPAQIIELFGEEIKYSPSQIIEMYGENLQMNYYKIIYYIVIFSNLVIAANFFPQNDKVYKYGSVINLIFIFVFILTFKYSGTHSSSNYNIAYIMQRGFVLPDKGTAIMIAMLIFNYLAVLWYQGKSIYKNIFITGLILINIDFIIELTGLFFLNTFLDSTRFSLIGYFPDILMIPTNHLFDLPLNLILVVLYVRFRIIVLYATIILLLTKCIIVIKRHLVRIKSRKTSDVYGIK